MMFTGCKSYKDIKLTSFEVVSVTPSGFSGVDVVVDVGVDNPIMGFEVLDPVVTLKMDGEPALEVSADQIIIRPRCEHIYRVPLKGRFVEGFNRLKLLTLVGNFDLQQFTADFTGHAALRGGTGINLDIKDIKVGEMMTPAPAETPQL